MHYSRAIQIAALSGLFLLFPTLASADEGKDPSEPPHDAACVALQNITDAAKEHSAQVIQLTNEQRTFLIGVYIMNPETPPGLPVGDRAVLVKTAAGKEVVFFVDGDQVCGHLEIVPELEKIMIDVVSGVVKHAGDGT